MSTFSSYLDVQGASIYYEQRGARGPVILIVPAGMGTAHAHEKTASILSENFRVVTYDRRGFSRSTINLSEYETLEAAEIIPRNAQDAALLIQHVSPGDPVLVFGSCLGGAIVLQLLANHPELVCRAVVHEPAIPLLVRRSARNHVISTLESSPRVLSASGSEAASEAEMSLVVDDMDTKDRQKSEAHKRVIARAAQHMEFHFRHESKAVPVFSPDCERLLEQRHKLALVIGTESTLPLQKDPAEVLAKSLSIPLLQMAGSHFPFTSDRDTAIEQLVSLFSRAQPERESVFRSRLKTNL